MATWTTGLTSQASARRASRWGGIAFLLQAAVLTIVHLVYLSTADKPLDNALAWFIGASFVPAFYGVAGIALWRASGWVIGALAALVAALDLVLFSRNPASIGAASVFAIKLGLLIFMASGVRGALALSKVNRGA